LVAVRAIYAYPFLRHPAQRLLVLVSRKTWLGKLPKLLIFKARGSPIL